MSAVACEIHRFWVMQTADLKQWFSHF